MRAPDEAETMIMPRFSAVATSTLKALKNPLTQRMTGHNQLHKERMSVPSWK